MRSANSFELIHNTTPSYSSISNQQYMPFYSVRFKSFLKRLIFSWNCTFRLRSIIRQFLITYPNSTRLLIYCRVCRFYDANFIYVHKKSSVLLRLLFSLPNDIYIARIVRCTLNHRNNVEPFEHSEARTQFDDPVRVAECSGTAVRSGLLKNYIKCCFKQRNGKAKQSKSQ